MARGDDPLFSLAELEMAAALPSRSVEMLLRHGLLPKPLVAAVRGGRPYWGEDTLARVAVIGAIFASTPSVTLAARLGHVIVDEFASRRGRMPTLFTYYRGIANRLTAEHAAEDGSLIEHRVHRELRRHPDVYRPGEARRDDLRIAIVDRRFVFAASVALPFVSMKGKSRPVAPEFVISGWTHGAGDDAIAVEPFTSALPVGWLDREDQDEAAAIEEAALQAWDNATSLLMINVSLAIRQAYDRIFDRRHGIEDRSPEAADTS